MGLGYKGHGLGKGQWNMTRKKESEGYINLTQGVGEKNNLEKQENKRAAQKVWKSRKTVKEKKRKEGRRKVG